MAKDRIEVGDILAAAEEAAPMASLDVVARSLRDRFDARYISFLFVDIVGRRVVRVAEETTAQASRRAEQIPLAGSVYDEALRDQRLVLTPDGEQSLRVVAPVTNRGDTIGVLELTLPRVSPDTLEGIEAFAHALAYIIVTDRRFTDLYHWARRTTPMSLAAEIQRQLLPTASCCEAAEFTFAAALVPADAAAGDTYDYSLDNDTLHLSITDAMGHDVEAALLATLLVNASRTARRAGCELAEQARRTHQAVLDHGRGALATGQLARIALDGSGALLVNAGHPWPLRLRDGTVEELRLHTDLPFGAPFPFAYEVRELDLRPGDRLVLYTDGMQERQAGAVDLAEIIRGTADLHPREAVQNMTTAVVYACDDHLRDDATVLCLDWHGPRADAERPRALSLLGDARASARGTRCGTGAPDDPWTEDTSADGTPADGTATGSTSTRGAGTP